MQVYGFSIIVIIVDVYRIWNSIAIGINTNCIITVVYITTISSYIPIAIRQVGRRVVDFIIDIKRIIDIRTFESVIKTITIGIYSTGCSIGKSIVIEMKRLNWFRCKDDENLRVFFGDLQRANEFFIERGQLKLSLSTNAGIMYFNQR